jgi:N-acetylneuraminic acid mutarotase
MRGYKESLVILGAGYLDNTLCTQMLAAGTKNGQLETFSQLNQTKDRRYFAAVAAVNDFVFIVGGQTAMAGDGSNATSTAFRYNPRDDKWLQISSMSVSRTHFALIATDMCLVAVGGKHNRHALNTAEKYDFASNEWKPIARLPTILFSHAGCTHNNKVYISGGCPSDDFTDTVHMYDFATNGWQYKAPMNQSRGYHAMVTHEDFLFVCAGNTNAGDRNDVRTTEYYDIHLDQWTVVKASPHGQSEAPAVKCGNKIYILGGYSWDAHSFQDTIQSYDMDDNAWEIVPTKLPEPMTGVVACHIKLPLKLYEESQQNPANFPMC